MSTHPNKNIIYKKILDKPKKKKKRKKDVRLHSYVYSPPTL